jgi:coenzyme F420-reducing hydrogenase alpha subunit
MRGQWGGRGGLGGAEVGHAYTTGASQALYQMTGRTPGLSSGGGSKATKKRRNAAKLAAQAERLAKEANTLKNKAEEMENRAEEMENKAEEMENKAEEMINKRHNNFKQSFVLGMPINGYEGNSYKHLSRNEMKNKIRQEALSEYVSRFGNNRGFNELNLELNNNK